MISPEADPSATNTWRDATQALWYLARADTIPHRVEGEATLLEVLPDDCRRVLDLGCGDGRLAALVLAARPGAAGLAADFSEVMLARAAERLADTGIDVVAHDLAEPLASGPIGSAVAADGPFDAVVSSFAIHHLPHTRKRALYREILGVLRPGGVFANLEHVASATTRQHERFMELIGEPDHEDPSNILAPVDEQLSWLRTIGYVEVDCLWRWRELALLVAEAPA
jgi:tRNA (cmo5U34)-methyltransferase